MKPHINKCAKCSGPRDRPHRSYCLKCQAAYMREWRKDHPLTESQAFKMRARSYAGVYLARGKIKKVPCRCGSTDVQMHHSDYSKPTMVTWVCKKCHLKLHQRMHNLCPECGINDRYGSQSYCKPCRAKRAKVIRLKKKLEGKG